MDQMAMVDNLNDVQDSLQETVLHMPEEREEQQSIRDSPEFPTFM